MRAPRTLVGGAGSGMGQCLGVGLLCILGAARVVGAQAGPELLVNSYTSGGQSFPALCTDAAGDFVVVWESGTPSPSEAGQDGSYFGVFGQRFGAGGDRRGAEFMVNTYTTDYQSFPAVACAAAGELVVVWSSFAQDGASDGIFGQRFGSTGLPLGGEFQINGYTTGAQSYPAVASDASGNFLVVWTSQDQDGDGDGVFARRYGGNGAPSGTEFRINAYTAGAQSYPTVAADAGGGFVVAWASAGQDGDDRGVFGRRLDSTGTPNGSEFQVNVTTAAAQGYPAVAGDDGGGFVVVWSSVGQDGDGVAIVGRRYAADGSPLGTELVVNTYTTGDQVMPDVAATGAGSFVVAWTSYGQDGSDAGIFARRFASTGAPLGTEFAVNSFTTAPQYGPAVSLTTAGAFVVAWASHQAGGDFSEIIARWYAAPTVTATPTRTATATAQSTATATPSLTRTPTPTATRTATPSRSPSPTSSPAPTATSSPAPTASATSTTEPTPTPTATETPTPATTATETPTPTTTARPPTGDCNGDGRVTIDELLLAIRIAFGDADLLRCEAADRDQDGVVTIEELVAAARGALRTI